MLASPLPTLLATQDGAKSLPTSHRPTTTLALCQRPFPTTRAMAPPAHLRGAWSSGRTNLRPVQSLRVGFLSVVGPPRSRVDAWPQAPRHREARRDGSTSPRSTRAIAFPIHTTPVPEPIGPHPLHCWAGTGPCLRQNAHQGHLESTASATPRSSSPDLPQTARPIHPRRLPSSRPRRAHRSCPTRERPLTAPVRPNEKTASNATGAADLWSGW